MAERDERQCEIEGCLSKATRELHGAGNAPTQCYCTKHAQVKVDALAQNLVDLVEGGECADCVSYHEWHLALEASGRDARG